ncbi:MAG: winged helix-turn-helix domain-containing protein [Methylophilaceae bacterium]
MNEDYLKIRIAKGRSIAMGPGKADLLEHIEANGSISAAAKKMKMSYRRAWELVDMMNSSFTQPLVSTSPGGAHGGGAQVTEFGFFILKSYRDLICKTNKAAQLEIGQITSHLKTLD